MKMPTFNRRLTIMAGWVAFTWTLLLVTGLIVIAVRASEKTVIDKFASRATGVALSASSLIQGEIHPQITSQMNESSPVYTNPTELFRGIERINNLGSAGRIARIYTLWSDPSGTIRFGVDTVRGKEHHELNSVNDEEVPSAALQTMRDGKPHCTQVKRFRDGLLLTAFAPVWGQKGKPVAVVAATLEAKIPPSAAKTLILAGLAIVLISNLMGMLIANFLVPAITRPLNAFASVTDAVATGDLRADIDATKLPMEFRRLAGSYQTMLSYLKQMALHMRAGVEQLRTCSEALKVSAATADRGAGDVAQVLSEVAVNAESVAESADRMVGQLGQVDQFASAVSERTGVANGAMAKIKEYSDRGVTIVGQVTHEVRKASQTITATANQVATFQKWSKEIDDVAGFIRKLADQISMLAVNAQIEAAHAGEVGQSFRVVTERICGLSEETAQFVERITELNLDMADHLSQIGESMSVTDQAMNSSMTTLDGASQAFLATAEDIRRAALLLSEIDDTVIRLKSLIEIGRNETSAVATCMQETAAGIERVSASAEEQAALADEVNRAVDVLTELAGILAKEVQQYRLQQDA